MPNFITDDCDVGLADFFHSGNYTRASFSTTWATRDAPAFGDDFANGDNNPIYIQVLNKHNIPFSSVNGLPPAGSLPGMDIKQMAALQAIRLSLSENLILGQWWDMYEDGEGGVYFQNVFNNGSPGKTVDLDIRLCIPAANKRGQLDMVVVTGYTPPPQRKVVGPRTVVPAGLGTVNPETITGDEQLFTVYEAALTDTCLEATLKSAVVKSYKDPLLDVTSPGPQEKNPLFEVQNYESLITYVIDIDGLDSSPEAAARTKFDFSPTTTWYQPLTSFPTFTRTSKPDTGCPTDGILTGGEIEYFEGSFTFTSPNYLDRYGHNWPLMTNPSSILMTGYKLHSVTSFQGGAVFAIVLSTPELYRLSEGSQYTYTIPGVNQFKFNIFYQPKLEPNQWEILLAELSGSEGAVITKVYDGRGTQVIPLDSVPGMVDAPGFIGVVGDTNSLGVWVSKMWVGWELDRPSLRVIDADGDALDKAAGIKVDYYALLNVSLPPLIVYRTADHGLVVLDADEQAKSIPDHDPTTCQNFEETPMQLMQDRQEGTTLNITLPFCYTVEQCSAVVNTIFEYQNYGDVQTYTLTCGPDDEPELGAAVNGFDSNLRIETISYSYQDGSSYTVEVTLGPVFSNLDSAAANGTWTRKVETVDRAAIVLGSAGDGVNYRVNIKGLGEFNAINGAPDIWRVGEIVQVKIHNVPIEE